MEKNNFTLSTAIIAAALILSAVIVGLGISSISKPARYVTVRGLAEQEVDADLAVWPLTFTIGGDNLAVLKSDIEKASEKVENYLKDNNLTTEDYVVKAPAITDTSVNPYMDSNRQKFTYFAKNVILVRSSKVNLVKQAQQNSLKLMEFGIAVEQDYSSKISFEFTGLNKIKPLMIAEATKNARVAAEQFARDSGSKVGKIKVANQGLFSIEDAAAGLEEKKNIRVVTTVEYLLKD